MGKALTHGATVNRQPTPEWNSWRGMVERCTNPNHKHWAHYGGRGIRVCDRWLGFAAFLADMGAKPTPEHSIDRINNDGNYEPGNCRWATRHEQARNKSTTRHITAHGKTLTLTEWGRTSGIPVPTIHERLRHGWDTERAVTEPPGTGPAPRGEKAAASKLTEDDVRYIRASSESGAALARKYGVSKVAISAIRRRRTWRHVE